MPINDPRDIFFYPHHTPMKDTYNLSAYLVNVCYVMTDATSLTFEVRGMLIEHCGCDGQEPIRQAELSQYSFCCFHFCYIASKTTITKLCRHLVWFILPLTILYVKDYNSGIEIKVYFKLLDRMKIKVLLLFFS